MIFLIAAAYYVAIFFGAIGVTYTLATLMAYASYYSKNGVITKIDSVEVLKRTAVTSTMFGLTGAALYLASFLGSL